MRPRGSLNLNGIAVERQAAVGPTLAEQFRTVMKQQIWFDWSDVPDRPDGDDDAYKMEEGQSHGPTGPRRNIRIYRLMIGDHDYEIRLERIKPRGEARSGSSAGRPSRTSRRSTTHSRPGGSRMRCRRS